MLRRHAENNGNNNPRTLNETGSFKRKMDVNGKEHAYSYILVEDIHNYAKKIAWTKKRLATLPQGDYGAALFSK